MAALHPSIASLLEIIFEEKPIATQSLLFERGSQQGIHQDPTYVVFDKPLFLAASWIALEDVRQGTGELIGWEGSHLIPPYLFSGKYKSWLSARDGLEQHKAYLNHIRTECEKLNCRRFHFLPKKGDVFIWINNFAHGGAAIKDEKKTRKSLVTHYTGKSILPNFAHFTDLYKPVPVGNSGYISARHYDLKQPTDRLRDPVIF
ncbi:MAG: phytanoyl-CoA dioxygenase family protein [Methylococcaceae bacterium]|nr:phytanoyl-CoA dioxygenase family protein [Methylococcaceae bacterium]